MIVNERLGMISHLIGEKSRAIMLWHLLGDNALTATELATCADVSPQSASMHLNKLVRARLLVTEKQGRHRYYRLSGPDVAYAVEAIANLLPAERTDIEDSSIQKVDEIRYCRTCYDHLAGRVGVLLTEQLLKHKIILQAGSEFELTRKGIKWFESLGIEITAVRSTRRIFARACLDWSERRHHLAGALGAAFLERILEFDWIRRVKHSRAIILTPKGRREVYDLLQLNL
jgi:DNA-binding transcriptional ArsR family regulator